MADDIGAAMYCECSAKTIVGVRDMFEKAVRLTLYDSRGQLKNSSTRTNKHSDRDKTKLRRACVLL